MVLIKQDLKDIIQKAEYIEGTHGTTATPTWTGTSTTITTLKKGQVIYFKMTSAGTSAGNTLNLTLADGTTTGAKNVYYNATAKLTTHFPVNTILELVYDGTKWLCTAIQNTNNFDRLTYASQITAGEDLIANTLVYAKSNGRYYKIASNGTLDIRYPILYNTIAVTSGNNNYNNYNVYNTGVNIQTTLTGKTVTAYQNCYLEGMLSGNTFTISSNVFVSDGATVKGKYYILLGMAYNTTSIRFNSLDKTVYKCVDDNHTLVPIPVEHTHHDTDIDWDGTNTQNSVSPLDMAMYEEFSANRLAFFDGDNIIVEYSTDGGTTWTKDTSITASNKSKITSTGGQLKCGNGSTTDYSKNQLRITFDMGDVGSASILYMTTRKLIIYYATGGASGSKVQISTSTYANPTTFTNVGDNYGLQGWSGWNSIPLNITLGGMASQTGNTSTRVKCLRLTFTQTGGTGNGYVNKVKLFGENQWTAPSNLARNGHIYNYNEIQDVVFPAKVTASSFIKSGGTSSQLLLANGDTKATNSFADSGHTHDSSEVDIYLNTIATETGQTLDEILSDYSTSGHNHDGTYIKTGTGTVTSTNIADKTIVNGDIADGTIESGKIKDGTIVNGDIANTTITGGKLVNGTVTATQLASNSVETAKIKDYAVDFTKTQEFGATGGASTTGYVKVMQITIGGAWKDMAITFDIFSRSKPVSYVTLIFQNNSGNDPSVNSFTYTGGENEIYIVKNTTSKWDIVVKKPSNDKIVIKNLQQPHSYVAGGVTFTGLDTLLSTAPTLASTDKQATFVGFTSAEKTKLSGIATGANKTTIVNDLTTGGTGSALSAEQGKSLKNIIDNGKVIGFGVATSTDKTNYTATVNSGKITSLQDGMIIGLLNNYNATNNANATLNLNGLGAKPIYYRNAKIGAGKWAYRSTRFFMYNTGWTAFESGNGCWILLGDVDTTYSAESTATNIKMNGTQAVGSLSTYARGDHIHPSDTSRVAVAQGTGNSGKFLKVNSSGNVACELVGLSDITVTEIKSTTDLNNLKSTGRYWFTHTNSTSYVSNAPHTGYGGLLIVEALTSSVCIQTFYEYHGSYPNIWHRLYNGSWTTWTKVDARDKASSSHTHGSDTITYTPSSDNWQQLGTPTTMKGAIDTLFDYVYPISYVNGSLYLGG